MFNDKMKKMITVYLPIVSSIIAIFISVLSFYYAYVKSEEENLVFEVNEEEKVQIASEAEGLGTKTISIDNPGIEEIKSSILEFFLKEKNQTFVIYNNSKQDVILSTQSIFMNTPILSETTPEFYSLEYSEVKDYSLTNENNEVVNFPVIIEANSYMKFKCVINKDTSELIHDFEKCIQEQDHFFSNYIQPDVETVFCSNKLTDIENFQRVNSFFVFKYEFVTAKNEIFGFYVLDNNDGRIHNFKNSKEYRKLIDK